MQIEPEIAFRHVEPTEATEEQIREGIEVLEEMYDRLTSCRIMVELPDRRHRTGNLYHVRIHLTMPDNEIVVSRSPPEHSSHEDLSRAIGEAFDQAREQLIEHARRRRGDVKAHEEPGHGRVVRLFPDYGFIDSADGLEVYFHRNSLVDGDFDGLEQGDEVRFAVEQGDKGPQASSVHLTGRHPVGN